MSDHQIRVHTKISGQTRRWLMLLLIAALLLPAGGIGGAPEIVAAAEITEIAEAAGATAAIKATEPTEATKLTEATNAVESGSAGGIKLNPIEELEDRPDFIRGADISMLREIEKQSGVYYDASGAERDLLEILQENGVNWIRLRAWVDPVDEQGQPLGGGNNDTETTVSLAKRAKALGLKVLLDFHYSDFWTDPGEQEKPKAWHDLSGDELAEALHDYTKDVLQAMAAEDASPDMVQIGNETNGGMVWPNGKTWQQTAGEEIGGYDGWASLIHAGTQAVRTYAPEARIVLHLANGGNNNLYRTVFGQLQAREVDFDIIGLSYYSYWHGTLEQLRSNMDDISARFGKDVMVVETAYAYTFDNGDGHGNIFGPNEENVGGYKASLQGQASSFRDVMEAVAKVPGERGLGAFYWEPAWTPVDGAGWKTGEGNAWDNQAMFDHDGKALPSLQAFDPASELYVESEQPAVVVLVRPSVLQVTVGETPTLPGTVKVEYSNDRIESRNVAWQPVPQDKLQYPGTFTVVGDIAGVALKATATITVQGAANYIANAGFESGSFSGWTVSGDTAAASVEQSAAPAGNAYNGEYSLHYWLDAPFAFAAKQTLSELPAGTYTLSARAHGGGGENKLQLYALCGDLRVEADIVNTGWQAWKQPTIQNISVAEGGSCELGVEVEGINGSWGNIDEVMFYRDASEITLQAPSAAAPGAAFAAELGVAGLASKAYSQDVTVAYDGNRFRFLGAEQGHYASALVRAEEIGDGLIRIISSHPQGLSAPGSTVILLFEARADASPGDGNIAVEEASLGTMPGGAVIRPTLLDSVQVKVARPAPPTTPTLPSTDGQSGEEPSVIRHEDGTASTTLPSAAVHIGGEASAELTAELLRKLVERAEGDQRGARVSIELTPAQGASGYALTLPASVLGGGKDVRQLELITPLGKLMLPAGMLEGMDIEKATIHIVAKDATELGANDADKAAIGQRPVLDLFVTSDGERLVWSNADRPVTVTIPYTESEAAPAGHYIVVWHIGADGTRSAVPNGRYDAAKGEVVFKTTHFSHYAIAGYRTTFSDIAGLPWAVDAIERLGASGVLKGTGQKQFSPDSEVKRADFAVMLGRALGLSAQAGTVFDDVTAGSYYAASVQAAAKLGIIKGDGNGKFRPHGSITRQEIVLMTVRALESTGTKLRQDTLESYDDAADVADYAKTDMGKAIAAGIVTGNNGRLLPAGIATRAEAAVLIDRMLKVLDQGEDE